MATKKPVKTKKATSQLIHMKDGRVRHVINNVVQRTFRNMDEAKATLPNHEEMETVIK